MIITDIAVGRQMSDDFLDPNPALDDALILRLTYDLAAKIHNKPTIAHRYGFKNVLGLFKYLEKHPAIVDNVKKARAIIESDEGSETRVKLKAIQATEALIAPTTHIAMDPRVAPQQRIDAFKQLSRVSGMDGSAAAMAAAKNYGPAFTLNILFRDNPDTPKLTFSTQPTTIEAELPQTQPHITTSSKFTPDNSDEFEDYEEDV
jgi:hypothetical protein